MLDLNAAPFILQIALFGAAGASFVFAHLKNLAAQRQSGETGNPGGRWRFWRHPHLPAPETAATRRLKQASLMQSIWGFVFLVGGFLTPFVFRFFHIGP